MDPGPHTWWLFVVCRDGWALDVDSFASVSGQNAATLLMFQITMIAHVPDYQK